MDFSTKVGKAKFIVWGWKKTLRIEFTLRSQFLSINLIEFQVFCIQRVSRSFGDLTVYDENIPCGQFESDVWKCQACRLILKTIVESSKPVQCNS